MIPAVQTVLAATDFLDVAHETILHAYAVVNEGGTVHLLHVIETVEPMALPNPLYAHYVPGRSPTADERRRQHAEVAARLRALVPADAEARRIQTHVHVLESDEVVRAVTDLAEFVDASVVCVGSHGRFGLAGILLGSVAREVVAQSRRSVLVVRVRHPLP
jgi:nucleotide-binding universal stress UspA family protein